MAMNIPSSVNSGDSISFTDDISDYPASTWTLSYAIVSSANKYEITAVAEGDLHRFSVLPSVTSKWKEGAYKWAASVTDGTDKFTLETGSLDVIPDFSVGPSDQRSHVERTLSVLEAAIEQSATNDQLSFSIAGRSVARYSLEEKIRLRDKYKAELVQIERKERIARGMASGAKVLVRF